MQVAIFLVLAAVVVGPQACLWATDVTAEGESYEPPRPTLEEEPITRPPIQAFFYNGKLVSKTKVVEDTAAMQVELPDRFFAVKVNFRSLLCASHSWRWVDWEDDKWEWGLRTNLR